MQLRYARSLLVIGWAHAKYTHPACNGSVTLCTHKLCSGRDGLQGTYFQVASSLFEYNVVLQLSLVKTWIISFFTKHYNEISINEVDHNVGNVRFLWGIQFQITPYRSKVALFQLGCNKLMGHSVLIIVKVVSHSGKEMGLIGWV